MTSNAWSAAGAIKLTAPELAARLGSWTRPELDLYHALAQALEALISRGNLPPGARLPAERTLAKQLNVSRGTVMSAFELLRQRGVVQTLHGSGTVVRPEASPVSGPREAHLTMALPTTSLLDRGLSDTGHIDLRSAAWSGSEAIEEVAELRLHACLAATASAGYDLLGLPELRVALAEQLTREGLPTEPDEILITTGAQQAISLITDLYVGAGDHVVVEDPTYPGAVEVLLAQQANVQRVPVGPAGVSLPALGKVVQTTNPRLVYLVPSVHNPTGVVMPAAARRRLGELLSSWNVLVVDDMTLAHTQIDGRFLSPLASFVDPVAAARVLTVGSLSKSVWDGLRVGWIRASRARIARLARLKSLADLGTPLFTQVIAAQLLRSDTDLFAHRRAQLRKRREALERLLHEQLPTWQWDTPTGGLCLWIDTGLDDTSELCALARRHGVEILPANTTSATDRFPGHLRLPYGHPVAVLEDGINRVAAAWRELVALRRTPPAAPGLLTAV